jgi:2-polyprenyl-3-methyl-5-hydroxy-6-metoxy-1,4-benzoquinol methylase
MISRFTHRSDQIEIMDDLQCSGEVVNQTLRELEFINKWLGGNAVTLDGIQQLIRQPHTSLRIADLGCGSGDMLKSLADWGKKNNVLLHLTGIDANPNIIEFAKANCKDYPEITLETLDVFSEEFHQRNFDIVMGTLFYHHFSNDLLIEFFSTLKSSVRVGFLINDIHRHWLAFHSIRILTRLFSKSAMVRYDAPLSVLRAFRKNELRDVLKSAGLHSFELRWKWAFRWQVLYRVVS